MGITAPYVFRIMVCKFVNITSALSGTPRFSCDSRRVSCHDVQVPSKIYAGKCENYSHFFVPRHMYIYDSQWQESEIISAIGCGTKQAVSFSAGRLDTFHTFFQMAARHMPVDLLSAGLEFKGKRERAIPDLIIYFERSKAPFVIEQIL